MTKLVIAKSKRLSVVASIRNMEKKVSTDDSLASGVVSARRKRGYSQEDLSSFMSSAGFDWHASTVSKVERGLRRLTASEAVVLASFLGTTVEELAGLEKDAWSSRVDLDQFVTQVIQSIAGMAVDEQKIKTQLEQLYTEIYEFDKDPSNIKELNESFHFQGTASDLLDVLHKVKIGSHIQQIKDQLFSDVNLKRFIMFSRNQEELLTLLPDEIAESLEKQAWLEAADECETYESFGSGE